MALRSAALLVLLATIPIGAISDAGLIARNLPRVVYHGGPFLRHPRIVTVTFTIDDPRLVARLREFGDTITRSEWWRVVRDGYCATPDDCIGEGRPGHHVALGDTLPARVRDADVADLLAREVNRGRFDPLDADSLLLVYLPPGVALSDAFVPRYCAGGPRAFHRMLRLERVNIPFAVIPRCGDERAVTSAASHEILEAVTNPDPARRGFAFQQESTNLGFTAAGVEPVDPCGLLVEDHYRESAFFVQRAWSNRAASLGRDPCVPATNRSYVALVPRTPTIRLAQQGASATIVLDAAADRTVPSWTVTAVDVTGRQHGAHYVDVSLDRSRVRAGDMVRLRITSRTMAPRQLCIVGLLSTLTSRTYMWPVAVVMR